MERFPVAYLENTQALEETIASGRNYWPLYAWEIFGQLGVQPVSLSLAQPLDRGLLRNFQVLFIGDVSGVEDVATLHQVLSDWVSDGGVLIAFGVEGLDELFGNQPVRSLEQEDDYECTALLELKPHSLPITITSDVHSILQPERQLLVFSSVRMVKPQSSKEVARLFLPDGTDTNCAGITHRQLRGGHAFYFGFDLAKTVWVLHQGRPIKADADGDGYLRTGDLVVIGERPIEVLYADELVFLLQNIIALRPIPFIHQLPSLGDEVPDALFHYGGDDEGTSGVSIEASEFMKSQGLPYHVNVMFKGGEFALTPPEAETILSNGHEISLHYNFIDDYQHPFAFTENDMRRQLDAFVARFGVMPKCSVMHWCCWSGWAEPARWMRSFGQIGDNSFMHKRFPPLNPINLLGFSFGTAFPFFMYEDVAHGNKRLDFVELPINAYETGYFGLDKEGTDFEIVHKVVETAIRYHLCMNLFYHPVYIARSRFCRAAIEEYLRYIGENGYIIRHMGTDAAALWWRGRANSTIENVHYSAGAVEFIAECSYSDGMVVKLPLEGDSVPVAMCRRQQLPLIAREEFGRRFAYIVCPQGRELIRVQAAKRSG